MVQLPLTRVDYFVILMDISEKLVPQILSHYWRGLIRAFFLNSSVGYTV